VIARAMGRTMKAPKKVNEKTIAFTTKDGKSIAFSGGNGKNKIAKAHIKQLEKRLSVMEKAVMKYNNAVQNHKAEKAKGVQAREHSNGGGEGKAHVASKSKKPDATVAGRRARNEASTVIDEAPKGKVKV